MKTATYTIPLRIPSELAERLREQAQRQRRSINAEVLRAIEAAIDLRTPDERERETTQDAPQ